MRHLCEELLSSACLPRQVFSNGHLGVRGNGNGHAHHGVGGSKSVKVMKGRKPHIKNRRSLAAWKAYGAVLLIQNCGLTYEQAIAATGSYSNYIAAMRWVLASGDLGLLRRALGGLIRTTRAAELVQPLVQVRAWFKKLTPEQKVLWASENDPEGELFNKVIVPAATMQKKIIEPAVVAAE